MTTKSKCLRTFSSIFQVPLKSFSTTKASPAFTVTGVPPSGVITMAARDQDDVFIGCVGRVVAADRAFPDAGNHGSVLGGVQNPGLHRGCAVGDDPAVKVAGRWFDAVGRRQAGDALHGSRSFGCGGFSERIARDDCPVRPARDGGRPDPDPQSLSKSAAEWRSFNCSCGSPQVRLTLRPRITAGRASIRLAQARTCL